MMLTDGMKPSDIVTVAGEEYSVGFVAYQLLRKKAALTPEQGTLALSLAAEWLTMRGLPANPIRADFESAMDMWGVWAEIEEILYFAEKAGYGSLPRNEQPKFVFRRGRDEKDFEFHRQHYLGTRSPEVVERLKSV